MYEKIIGLVNCYGCGVCSAVCPVDIISFERDADGFRRPSVTDPDKCTRCGLCSVSCAAISASAILRSRNSAGFACRSEDPLSVSESSSGGAAFHLALDTIKDAGECCLCRYDTQQQQAEHYIASDAGSLLPSRGSKYLQSDSPAGLRSILKSPKERKTVFATPCTIASLDRYLRKTRRREEFLLVDFFCHGIPSYHLWNQYTVENKFSGLRPDKVIFRDKRTGWHDSYAVTAFREGSEIFYDPGAKNLFFKLYLRNYVLHHSCYTCPFRGTESSADIRVGDFWGKEYSSDKKGVSAIITFGEKGKEILGETQGIELHSEPVEKILCGQLKGNLKVPPERRKILNALRCERKLSYIYKRYVLAGRIKRLPRKLLGYIK